MKLCRWRHEFDANSCTLSIIFLLVIPPYECLPKGYTELNETDRHWSFDNGGTLTCDRSIIVNNQWYRFTGPAGKIMASHCIPKWSCNTEKAAWIKDGHPTHLYKLVTRDACFHWESNCCSFVLEVKIRKCDGFYVYQLKAPGLCHERYCAVNGMVYFDFLCCCCCCCRCCSSSSSSFAQKYLKCSSDGQVKQL